MNNTDSADNLQGRRVRFADCLCVDRPRLIGLQRKLRRVKADQRERLKADFETMLAASRRALAEREAARPRPEFPPELPVTQKREAIAAAIREHQVIIVSGETGSGKTTQLPKICLELGRGAAGLIGHTQPRRLAARSTATRVAQELRSDLGKTVGYKIRFTDRVSPATYVKLMTDGILLAETQGDPSLSAYDTLIIDEAHERSLNIDFLLGYLKTLLPRRPDLKVIITSATLDAERFARHFGSEQRPVPVIEVSGRLYPIEMRYRPLSEEDSVRGGRRGNDNGDLYAGIVDAVDEARRCGPGDVLVFLPGEREIREAAEAVRKSHHGGDLDVLPLFARQSAKDQSRVFSPGGGKRRVVLATNVAETSLTVPGIRYVVDSGLARVKRYSYRNKVEQLQIEKVAQSSARQRAGRCGRVADGVCFRLYEEEDFERRPTHAEPEILRSSLAGVILRMRALKLGTVEDFPFVDPPQPRMIADGYQLLGELGAVSEDAVRELTPVGEELARLPLDPKVGRMILAARDFGCLAEVLVIAAALSVQDPRERVPDNGAAADQAHARFSGREQDRRSEFLWYRNLWQAWCEVQRHQSGNKQKAWCRQHYLSYLRMREWRDVHSQLHTLCAEHGWRENQLPARYDAIHKALLTGLLSNAGVKLEEARGAQAGAYLGARGIRFWPHPGSALAKKAGKWVVCAEQLETTRLFGRCLARIEPQWLEEVGAHMVKRQVGEPYWSKKHGAVRARESGTLYGLPLYSGRGVSYRHIGPQLCRDLLIRDGLVAGLVSDAARRNMPFLEHNLELVEQIEWLEHKSRRPDVLVDETLIAAFYDSRIPENVLDLADLEKWRRKAERDDPRLLYLTQEQLMRHEAAGITTERFPATLEVFGQPLPLFYLHEPGARDDGVTLEVPLAMLNQIPAERCEWLVPGLLEEKVLALLRTVPQKHRHRLQPLAESATDFVADVEVGEIDHERSLLRELRQFVETRAALKLPLESFRPENLQPHFFMNFRVVDENGRVLGQSRDLGQLRTRFGKEVSQRFSQARVVSPGARSEDSSGIREAGGTEPVARRDDGAAGVQSGFTDWTFGALPELMEVRLDGREVVGFPALHDDGDSVSLRPYDTPEEAQRVHRQGLVRLFALRLKNQVQAIGKLPGMRDLALLYLAFGSEAALRERLVRATLERVCLVEPWPTDAEAFAQRCAQAKPRVTLVGQELMRLVREVLTELNVINRRLGGLKKTFPDVVEDIEVQLEELLPKDFLVAYPFQRLTHLPRYLKAVSVRLDKQQKDPARDRKLMDDWIALAQPFDREWLAMCRAGAHDPALEEFRWLLEELRVGLFAQELKTPMPVSVKRLQKIWHARPR